ncbi:MAG TPA: arylsulfatase [Thermoguttaceae bacterium]|nr:arylsulfatase [Thermoguttaceae bacterium]
MNGRHVRTLALLLASVVCPGAIAAETRAIAAETPNIVFIIVDDMGYHDLGCFGSKTILTPNIDRMCAEGIKFTDCYSGDTVCAPARSTLMTGYHKGHTPVRGNSGGIPLWPEDVTVAEVLKKAGYATGGFGKWGLGNQGHDGAAERQGFDLFFGYYNQWHAHTYYTHLFRNSERVELAGRYTHHAIFDETIKFIQENKDKPFFCYCPWTPPHAAYQIPEDDPAWALYKDKPWPQDARVVAAMDSMIDRHVGEILALLEELDIDDDTIVFFTSDNGAAKRFDGIHDSCGKMKGFKRSMNEGGIRVPMVVRWPGRIEAGSVSDLPWYFPDVMPTLAELANVSAEVPEDIDGISIVPTLLGKGEQKRHEYLYWASGNRAVRMGQWKGLGSPGKLALYDLSSDIGEENDLAAEHPDIVEKLADYMASAEKAPRSQQDDGKYTGRESEAKKTVR